MMKQWGILLFVKIMYLIVSCERGKPMDSLGHYPEDITVFEKGLISTLENHEGLSYISPKKDVVIFTRSDKNYEQSGLFISQFLDNAWTFPKKLRLTNSSYEAGITFSPKKSKAFFTNKTMLKNGDSTNLWNIWEIEYVGNYNFLEETAKPLQSPINSDYQDCCLTMNSNGNAYFSSNRDGSWDMYSADYVNYAFQNIKKLDYPINTDESGEWPSHVNQANSILWFSSIRKQGLGGDDIYISQKINGSWQQPVLLDDSINSKFYEDSATITLDSSHFFFSSGKPFEDLDGVNNVYIAKIKRKP